MIYQEWRLAWREQIVPAAALIYIAVTGYALWNGAAGAKQECAEVERFQELDRARLNRFRDRAATMERQLAEKAAGPIPVYEFTWGPKRPAWSPAWAPQSAILPPGRLAAFMIGQRDLHPLAYSGYRPLPTVRPAGNPLALLHGSLDLAFVTLYLLPLVILGTCFNSLSADRESGTAGLLLSQPVSTSGILLRRIGLRAGILLALHSTLVAAAVGWLARDAWLLGLAWIVSSLMYGLFWAALSFWLNARGRSSPRNAVVLGVVWLSMLVIIPAAILGIGESAYPVPSRIESVRAKRQAYERAASVADAELVRDHLSRHPEFAGRDYLAEGKRRMLGYARWEAEEDLLRDRERMFDIPLRQQRQFADAASLLTPAALTRSILLNVSGAGQDRYEHFVQQAAAFRQRTRNFFWPLIYEDGEFRAAGYARVPQFHFDDEDPRVVVSRVAWPLAILFGVTVACASAGYRSCRQPHKP